LDEGVLSPETQYTLTQLQLGSKLPSLRNPLPHGRGKILITRKILYRSPPKGGAQSSPEQSSRPRPSAGHKLLSYMAPIALA